MIEIRDVETLDGEKVTHCIASEETLLIDGRGLVLFPGLIDPHVHFRTPGLEYKEDWISGAKAALAGGITTLFDMPNTLPATITAERLSEKSALIDHQLKQAGILLHYGLYLGADKAHFAEIASTHPALVGLKIFMGSSTGDLVMDDEESLHRAFQLAKMHDLLVAVHAEDEALIHSRKALFRGNNTPSVHSQIRNRETAYLATKRAIELARTYGTRLYLLHISTREELPLIAEAKAENLPVFAEVTPHHLFLDESAYQRWGTKVQVNPPLRTPEDREALWEALHLGTIDTIGSDHAPHTLAEKSLPYGEAPSGIPGVETTLPLLLNSGRLSHPQIVQCMKSRIEEIFRLPPSHDDYVLVDPNRVKTVEGRSLHSKCGWSPYEGLSLKGWPIYTFLKNRVYKHV
jgi:dihydroorotase